MKTMAEKIESVKISFVRGVKHGGLESRGLRAMFSIGSTANTKTFRNESYQDFDIHLFFDRLDIDKETLKEVKMLFQEIARKHEDQDTAVEFTVKDRPWKMIPRKPRNIGIHGTILNSLDFKRRIERNYILALNMFQNAEVLCGELYCPKKIIFTGQFLSEVGGIGWLEDLYFRLLPFIDPNNESMYPMAIEVSYYFGLSPLLHFFYLHNKRTATRKECFSFFMSHDDVPDSIKEATRLVMGRNVKNRDDCQKILHCAFQIMQFVRSKFDELERGPEKKSEQEIFRSGLLTIDEDSDLASEVLKRRILMSQKHCLLTPGSFNRIQGQIRKLFMSFSNPTPDDYVEVLRSVIENGLSEVDRPYFWISGKNQRFFNGTDFRLHATTADFLLYSWEKGIATFIQRLHEAYLNKECLDDRDVSLARILTLVAYKGHLAVVNDKIPTIQDLVSLFEKDGNLKGISNLNVEDQFFAYLRVLYWLAKKNL